MSALEIGQEIEFQHGGEVRTGKVVGLELAKYRRGYPQRGHVAVVQPEVGEPVEIHVPEEQVRGGITIGDTPYLTRKREEVT